MLHLICASQWRWDAQILVSEYLCLYNNIAIKVIVNIADKASQSKKILHLLSNTLSWVFSEEDLAYPAGKIALLDMATLGNTQRTQISSC